MSRRRQNGGFNKLRLTDSQTNWAVSIPLFIRCGVGCTVLLFADQQRRREEIFSRISVRTKIKKKKKKDMEIVVFRHY